jgi:hypothetical protein
MTGQRDKRFCLPGDNGWHTQQSSEPIAERNREPQAHAPTVRCPNPACGLQLIVPLGPIGESSTCSGCGATIHLGGTSNPSTISARMPQPTNAPARSAPATTEQPANATTTPVANVLTSVRTGCIGRGNAGKTALFRALSDGPVGDFLPSGLHVDAGDPREVARMIRESEHTQRLLHEAGLPPTRVAAPIHYYVYEGSRPRASYHLHEVIGQVLTHTLPDSAAQQQACYDEYLANLINTHVLWVVVPCPPSNPGPREQRRYANDLRIALAYLREAIRLRSLEQPVAVALVLSKIDTLFSSASAARLVLTDDTLIRALGPLVDLIQTSERVSESAIIPVSAFGFGNAMVKEGSAIREGASPDAEDEPFRTEPIWILREGVDPAPFNLDALFLWTLLFGLRGQEDTGNVDRDRDARRLSDQLLGDLEAANPWILPLNLEADHGRSANH